MWTVFWKVFVEFVTMLFLVYAFGPKVCGVLAPRPGIELSPPALQGGLLTSGPQGSLVLTSLKCEDEKQGGIQLCQPLCCFPLKAKMTQYFCTWD